jgi:hypothetical protein
MEKEPDDFVETFDDHAPKHGYCSHCKQVKPLAAFKVLLPRANTKANGYAGFYRVQTLDARCKDCRPRDKPLSQLSEKQIRNRLANGDITALMAESLIKKRKQDLVLNRKRSTKMQWQAKWKAEWKALIKGIAPEFVAVRQQKKHAEYTSRYGVIAYADGYLAVLEQVRNRLRIGASKVEGSPPHTHWVEFVTQHEYSEVVALWDAIPFHENISRVPVVVDRAMKPLAIPPKNNTLAAVESPAVRLALGGGEAVRNKLEQYSDRRLLSLIVAGRVDSHEANAIIRRRKEEAEALRVEKKLAKQQAAFDRRVAEANGTLTPRVRRPQAKPSTPAQAAARIWSHQPQHGTSAKPSVSDTDWLSSLD